MQTGQTSYQRLPTRGRIARRIIQSYNFARGKDRLYLILQSALRLPTKVIADITPEIDLLLDLDDYLQRWMFCHRLREEPDYFLMSRILKRGEHFIDVGANIGIVSLLAARAVGSTGLVYAFEPLPLTREHLRENIELNEIANVRVFPFAVMDRNSEVDFFASADGNIGGSSLSAHGQKDGAISVTGCTLDSLVEDGVIQKCDVMKLDIEGAEILAIKGMSGLLISSKPRAILIEVSDLLLAQFGARPADITEFFSDHGYEWFRASSDGFLRRVAERQVIGFNNLWAVLPGAVEDSLIKG